MIRLQVHIKDFRFIEITVYGEKSIAENFIDVAVRQRSLDILLR